MIFTPTHTQFGHRSSATQLFKGLGADKEVQMHIYLDF